MKKSDEAIVEKSANKGERSLAEPMERRASPRGETGEAQHVPDESRGSVTRQTQSRRVHWRTGYGSLSNRNRGGGLTALLHHVTVDALREAYGELKRWAAPAWTA